MTISEQDKAATYSEFRAILLSIASGNAPSEKLRTMALRAYRNQDVTGLALSAVQPTDEERAELDRLLKVATAARH